MNEELVKLRADIESLKRQLLGAILAELQETIRLREAAKEATTTPTRLTIIGDSELLGPAQPTTRVRR